jgi:hypothetical protein
VPGYGQLGGQTDFGRLSGYGCHLAGQSVDDLLPIRRSLPPRSSAYECLNVSMGDVTHASPLHQLGDRPVPREIELHGCELPVYGGHRQPTPVDSRADMPVMAYQCRSSPDMSSRRTRLPPQLARSLDDAVPGEATGKRSCSAGRRVKS